ncbi:Uncharacterised protein [Vibrio cholerae]|nr:Uncharacterised protein [Vibrio cholerae]CSC23204.1 Uncharacterised protein [Vibrio cholerae]CSC48955.1 Uncharacterised protein [Vibrio cholerae]CSC66350.1 Uncharacterised protein [Vibrio cholerae]CSC91272.1 Uncharacterised protein [Vibrio cholerae]
MWLANDRRPETGDLRFPWRRYFHLHQSAQSGERSLHLRHELAIQRSDGGGREPSVQLCDSSVYLQ